MRILIAEDDEALAKFVRQGLEAEHYSVEVVRDGEQALAAALASDYEAIVLDLNFPKLDGVGVLRQLRIKKPSLPILILTQRTRVEDRVQCLDTGADDYLGKPFSFSELSARIRALIRRSHLPSESVLTVADLKLDRVQRMVEREGLKIELTSKEFALLEYLMRNAGRDVTRSMIIEHVWNLTFDTTTNVVDVYINYFASCRLEPTGLNAALQLDLKVAFPIIDLLLGGEGKSLAETRELSEIEVHILDAVARIVCRELGAAWQALSLEFQFDQRLETGEAQRLMLPEDKTLCLSFEITMPDVRGGLNLAVPATVSNALLRKISSDWNQRRPRLASNCRERMMKQLLECPFEVDLSAKNLRLPVRRLADLAPGDLLVFTRFAAEPATLLVAGAETFRAAPARCGEHRAAKLVAPVSATPELTASLEEKAR